MSLSSLACDKHDHKPHVFFWPFHTMYAKINFSHSFLQLLSLLSCIFQRETFMYLYDGRCKFIGFISLMVLLGFTFCFTFL